MAIYRISLNDSQTAFSNGCKIEITITVHVWINIFENSTNIHNLLVKNTLPEVLILYSY